MIVDSRLDTMRLLLSKAQQSVANCIQQSTYGTGFRRWVQFVSLFGTDPFMRTVPPEFAFYKAEMGSGGLLYGLPGMVARTA